MVTIKLYSECVRLKGEKVDPYIRINDVREKPAVRSCNECDHFNKCLSQYMKFHDKLPVENNETSEEPSMEIDIHKKKKNQKEYWVFRYEK